MPSPVAGDFRPGQVREGVALRGRLELPPAVRVPVSPLSIPWELWVGSPSGRQLKSHFPGRKAAGGGARFPWGEGWRWG